MKKIALSLALISVIGGIFLLKDKLANFSFTLPKIDSFNPTGLIEEIKKEISAPAPIRAKREAVQSFLTVEGVTQLTNVKREENKLLVLTVNQKLARAASLKIQDMFQGQYFAHQSPSGLGPDYWVETAGYEFISIGENLALGNFKNDAELVQGWMDSPGHRANILSSRFEEIGVAVKRGTFEGKTTWLAVQIFGKPTSSCPKPSDVIKTEIQDTQSSIQSLRATLEAKRLEIENTPKHNREEYNQKVAEYNALVQEYNKLVEAVKDLIANYNNQINIFNECLKQ